MALDRTATKDSLFGAMRKTEKQPPAAQAEIERLDLELEQSPSSQEEGSQSLPKWQTLDKVTVLFSSEQKDGLDRIAKKLMKYRARESKSKEGMERITANTLIRALVNIFLINEKQAKPQILATEDDVCTWVKNVLAEKD